MVRMRDSTRVTVVAEDIFTGRQDIQVSWDGSTNVVIPTIETVYMLVLASACYMCCVACGVISHSRSLLDIKADGQLVALDSSGKTVTNLTVPISSLLAVGPAGSK